MDSITLKNYRCFRKEQTARLAPLTLLVGENSTGKTSFLAMLRALYDVAFLGAIPNFREEPYDLGAFENIVHNGGAGVKNDADSFEAGFTHVPDAIERHTAVSFNVTFRARAGVLFPSTRRLSDETICFEMETGHDSGYTLRFRAPYTQWEYAGKIRSRFRDNVSLFPLELTRSLVDDELDRGNRLVSSNAALWNEHDWNKIRELAYLLQTVYSYEFPRPFAGAPVRSRPKRTYDPIPLSPDAEGDYIPTFLANLSRRSRKGWEQLKERLDRFGRESGLFDEIAIESFGETEGSPFQVHIRKSGKGLKGQGRNLIDVGYGVSQALPVLTELLRTDTPTMFLLQQPEVHLHPSAQAVLGSLFCSVAASGTQLVVETHSDYIIDRVRMDIRDRTTELKPDDVSILYFERDDLEVNIHSIRIDEMGNLIDAPPGYRQFFADELRRSIGL